jgi:hypothetical protein
MEGAVPRTSGDLVADRSDRVVLRDHGPTVRFDVSQAAAVADLA